MSGKGVKRASPGADEEKNPLGEVELSNEDALRLSDIQKVMQRAEIALERRAIETLAPKYAARREVLKAIPKFWAVALMNSPMFSIHAQHHADQAALSYLEDLWLVRDPAETRVFTIEMHFKENPYFKNSVLKKEFKYAPPPGAADETPGEDGLTDSMIDFNWERDVEGKPFKIDWKDESKTLTKLYPRVADDSDDDIAESGSFFHFFERADDPYDIGVLIGNDIFPDAIEYFLGQRGEIDTDDEDSEEEDDDDDDAEEIDLEKPRVKRAKH
ncbi:hypothetical protein BDW22DRAFT_1327620 [Trametopsis cervina]|nr:hypothetical protein BDW22DRAFT_1327620 [Trametopsis cervina]